MAFHKLQEYACCVRKKPIIKILSHIKRPDIAEAFLFVLAKQPKTLESLRLKVEVAKALSNFKSKAVIKSLLRLLRYTYNASNLEEDRVAEAIINTLGNIADAGDSEVIKSIAGNVRE